MNLKTPTTKIFLKSFFLLAIFALSLQAVATWQPPTVAPTGGNVATPVNSGADAQIKSGGLTVGFFQSNGVSILSGSVDVGGTLTISSGSPAANKILTSTNASGVATWSTLASLGGMTNPMTAIGDIIYGSTATTPSTPDNLPAGANGTVLKSNGPGTAPSWATLTGAGSPFGSQSANTFFAAPNGSAGNPTFRTILLADLPTITVAKGGTGLASIAGKSILVTSTADTITPIALAGGQSIRRNSGDTAWEAYTPSSGGVPDGNYIDIQVAGSTWTINPLVVTTGKIADGAINNPKILNLAVDNPKIAANAITTDKITDLTIGTADIANNAVTIGKLPAGATGTTFLRGDGTWVVPSSSAVWGSITGTLSNQTDLQTALNAKQNLLVNSAGLLAALSDETGTGLSVFSTSPTFTGDPKAPTPTPASDNDTSIATTAFVQSAVSTVSLPSGTSGQTLRHNGTTWSANSVLFNNGTNVGIGDTTPGNKLEITHGTAGNSGLRFTNLTSASTPGVAGTKVLSVNASGDVVLVTDATGSGGGGTVGGTGTQNYITKWTATGADITNSQIWDNGANVGVNTNTTSNRFAVNQGAHATPATYTTYGFALMNQGTVEAAIGSDATNAYLQSWNAKPLVINGQGNNVGIGDTSPDSLLSVGSGSVLQVNSAGDIIRIKGVTYAWPGANGSGVLTNNGSGTLSWAASSSSVPINTLLAATNSNNINNGAHNQTWRWDTLGGGIGLNLQSSASGTVGQKLFQVDLSGASAVKTTAASFSNARTGASSTNVGIHSDAVSVSGVGTNIAAEFEATGAASNYAIVTTGGSVGINDPTPDSLFAVGVNSPFQVNSNGNIIKIENVTYDWPNANAVGYLSNSGTGTLTWTNPSSGGITTLNSQTGAVQSFANDTNVTISSTTNVHTLGWSGTLARARGGTGLSTAADDTVLFSNGTAWSAVSIPACLDSGGNHLNYNNTTNAFSCGTSGSGGGGVTSVTASNTSLTISPTTGAVLASLNLANANTWTATQTFSNATSAASFTTPTSFSGQLNLSSNFSQTGATAFGTGTGTVSLNGNTVIPSGKTLTLPFTAANGIVYASNTGVLSQTAASTGAQCLQTTSAGAVPSWGACGSGGGATAISALGDAVSTDDDTVGLAGFAQTWNWPSLTIDGLVLSSNSTLANTGAGDTQKLFRVVLFGANATAGETTYASHFTNSHTGSTSTNIAGYFSATGGTTNNFALFATGTGTGLVNGLRINHGTEGSSWDLAVGGSSNSYSGGFAIADSGIAKLIITSKGNVGTGGAVPTDNFAVSQGINGTGTVTTAASGFTVTGSGTQFTNTFKVGDTITVSGESVRTINVITSDTILTVSVAFSATPHNGVTYTLTGGTRFAVSGNGDIEIGTNGTIYRGTNRFIHTRSGAGTNDESTFVGVSSGNFTATSGSFNVGFGSYSLDALTTGGNNIAVGYSSLGGVTTGSSNVGVGHYALGGGTSTVGTGNAVTVASSSNSGVTAVGNIAGVTAATGISNATAIGNGAGVGVSNKVRIGNTAVSIIEGQVAWSFPSDIRIKKEVTSTDLGLDFIMKLRPVSYKLKEGDSGTSYGFIAQEVEAAAGKQTNIVLTDNSTERMKTMRYTDLIAPMTKAIQEQQAQIEILRAEIEKLKAR